MTATFTNEKGQTIQRTPCEVYTRVMGYLRPAKQYNIGKKSEFYSRKYFKESQIANSEFMRKFSGVGCGC